ncbi:MAG: exonuclease domain-containing protein, partial [Oscillospiraceae bacterium]|nr:exonuclease domain-containing protein [Oscillospiraceae bacterium]
AYNAQFDLCFLYYFLYNFGKNDALKNTKMLDVLTVYRDRKPYPHKLIDAVSMYSLDTNNAHRALDDARVTFELLSEMGKELDDLEHYINLFGYNPKYGVSGPKISSVKYLPQGYDRIKKLYEK